MGRKCANPKLLEISGHYRKNGGRPEAEIPTESSRPLPSLLIQSDELTLALFNETCESLESMGILAKQDLALIEAYVCNYRELVLAIEQMRKEGPVVEGTRGPKTNPIVTHYHNLMSSHRLMLGELGLTPSARAKMVKPTANRSEGDPVGELMKRLGGGNGPK